jgi:hypothetical protein
MPILGLAIPLPPGRAAAVETSSMLGDAARLRFKRMDLGDLEVSVLPSPRRLFRLSDLGVQIADIGVHFPDMGVQIETIEVFRFERDAHTTSTISTYTNFRKAQVDFAIGRHELEVLPNPVRVPRKRSVSIDARERADEPAADTRRRPKLEVHFTRIIFLVAVSDPTRSE